MMELLEFSFFRNAFLMCLMLSLLFGLLSFFIVLRRMVFLGAGISHTAFGGVALGLLLGIHPFITALIFCVAVALIIGKMAHRGRLSMDTAIGIFFSFAMALGAVFISMKKAYSFDLSGYLFGNILGVGTLDLLLVLAVCVIAVPFFLLQFQKLLFMTFEEEAAAVSGIRTAWLESGLLVILALVIVVSIKIVGIILVSALVVLPASFGMLVSRAYSRVLGAGFAYILFVMTGGLFLSYQMDLPAGATMVVLGTALYFGALAIRSGARTR